MESAIGWVDDLFHLFGREPPANFTTYLALLVILLPLPIVFLFVHSARPRQGIIPPYRERVLILGASSGVGEELALQYSQRGCRNLVLVARRGDELARVKAKCEERRKIGEEWEQSQQAPGWEGVTETVHTIQADCTKPEDLLKIRQLVRKNMGGLDTLHIVFGASALQSLLGTAGIDPITSASPLTQANAHATLEGITATLTCARKIFDINAASTAAILVAFLPLLQFSSASPCIVLLSSVAALVPPPTRGLYGASKAAQLQIFQVAALEAKAQSERSSSLHSSSSQELKREHVNFYALAPGTIRTDFRLSAVDGPIDLAKVRDATWKNESTKGSSDILEVQEVAHGAIRGADRMKTGVQIIPTKYKLVRVGNLFLPNVIGNLGRKKYRY